MYSFFRINRKGEVRKLLDFFLREISDENWSEALVEISRLEENLCQHLLMKDGTTLVPRVRELCRRIKLYLVETFDAGTRKRQIFRLLEKLKKLVDFFYPLTLERIYEELKEDWTYFWSTPDVGNLNNLKDDLDMLSQLEPEMRKRSDDEYKKFREILTKRGKCYTLFPYLSAMSRGAMLPDQVRQRIFDAFSELFQSIEPLLAPYKFEYKVGELELKVKEE